MTHLLLRYYWSSVTWHISICSCAYSTHWIPWVSVMWLVHIATWLVHIATWLVHISCHASFTQEKWLKKCDMTRLEQYLCLLYTLKALSKCDVIKHIPCHDAFRHEKWLKKCDVTRLEQYLCLLYPLKASRKCDVTRSYSVPWLVYT